MNFGLVFALLGLAALLWCGLRGMERLVQMRRAQEPGST